MKKAILVIGATGNLGGKIVDALLKKEINVVAVVRMTTDQSKIQILKDKGVKVFQININDNLEVIKCCKGVDCVVSALAGLRETIIDIQKLFLDAAIIANVPRFIPSGFAIDYTNLVVGQNRNLDLRREFDAIADKTMIKTTTIFNGPFMDLLTTDLPLILTKINRILCWGNPNLPLEFTHTLDIAEFTANVALDSNTPRYMRIAGEKLTCYDFVKLLTELTEKQYKILKPGGIGFLNFMIKMAKFFQPGNNELYPAWQGMQYMRDMMEGRIIFQDYDNNRYPLKWTSVKSFLEKEKVSRV